MTVVPVPSEAALRHIDWVDANRRKVDQLSGGRLEVGIGSGGPYALAAARALLAHTQMKPAEVVRAGLEIAGDICVYTNRNIDVVELT